MNTKDIRNQISSLAKLQTQADQNTESIAKIQTLSNDSEAKVAKLQTQTAQLIELLTQHQQETKKQFNRMFLCLSVIAVLLILSMIHSWTLRSKAKNLTQQFNLLQASQTNTQNLIEAMQAQLDLNSTNQLFQANQITNLTSRTEQHLVFLQFVEKWIKARSN